MGALLEEANQKIPESLASLLEFTDFAVAFRYDAFPDLEGDMDRPACIDRVGRLLERVRWILTQANS